MRDTKSDNLDRPSAPDFTQACVVMFGVNLAWMLIAIWALFGFLAALAAGFAVKRGIDWLGGRRG